MSLLIVVLIQIVLPVALIAWLAFLPAASLVGFAAQALGAGLAFLGLALVAIWSWPPWWIPYVYGLLWAMAVAVRFARARVNSFRAAPAAWPRRIGVLTIGCLGVFGAYLALNALLARRLPDGPVVDIPMPVGNGTYLVVNGGSREIVNGHLTTLDSSIERFRAYRGQSYAIDLLKVGRIGLRASGWRPEDPTAYEIFGEPVRAPCDGVVVSSRNDRPDMPVPIMDREYLPGNHILLRCGDVELLLAHFRKGSVRFTAGERVEAGEILGEVGNSGNSSEPHLHLHAQRPSPTDDPLGGEPLWLTINGAFPVRNDRLGEGG